MSSSQPLDLCKESTYWVDGPIEEIQAAAAHLLADSEPKIETRYLIRIGLSDVAEAGLHVEDLLLGETGVPWLDFRHRDLVGTKDQFHGLVGGILGRLRLGEDRIRRIGKTQYEHALQHFLGLPATDRPTHTRNLIDCVLKKNPVMDIEKDLVQTKEELGRLTIPEETISLRAFCLYRDGRGTGSPSGDWEMAQRELRAEYGVHYLKTHFGSR